MYKPFFRFIILSLILCCLPAQSMQLLQRLKQAAYNHPTAVQVVLVGTALAATWALCKAHQQEMTQYLHKKIESKVTRPEYSKKLMQEFFFNLEHNPEKALAAIDDLYFDLENSSHVVGCTNSEDATHGIGCTPLAAATDLLGYHFNMRSHTCTTYIQIILELLAKGADTKAPVKKSNFLRGDSTPKIIDDELHAIINAYDGVYQNQRIWRPMHQLMVQLNNALRGTWTTYAAKMVQSFWSSTTEKS